jgi:hypothetical protein
VRKLVRLAVLVGLAVWAWRTFFGGREPHERASVSYADGSSLVLEPGSPEFERFAVIARTVLDR